MPNWESSKILMIQELLRRNYGTNILAEYRLREELKNKKLRFIPASLEPVYFHDSFMNTIKRAIPIILVRTTGKFTTDICSPILAFGTLSEPNFHSILLCIRLCMAVICRLYWMHRNNADGCLPGRFPVKEEV